MIRTLRLRSVKLTISSRCRVECPEVGLSLRNLPLEAYSHRGTRAYHDVFLLPMI